MFNKSAVSIDSKPRKFPCIGSIMYAAPSLYGYVLNLIPRRRKHRNAGSDDPQH
jgi:hypothetical protein